jgi:hypothetical protein
MREARFHSEVSYYKQQTGGLMTLAFCLSTKIVADHPFLLAFLLFVLNSVFLFAIIHGIDSEPVWHVECKREKEKEKDRESSRRKRRQGGKPCQW